MEKRKVWTSNWFCGFELTEEEKKNGFISYGTFAKPFCKVLCNGITKNWENWTLENGCDYDEENDECVEVFQYYIVDDFGASLIQDYTNNLLWYDEELDIYIWGITHFGTAWDYVNTDIAIQLD